MVRKLKIGLVAFGSGVRGIVAEEESSSNAAIIEAPAYKYLVEHLNAEFYIIGPAQQKCTKIINKESPELWKDYVSSFTICTPETEPEDLDLIWVQSGSDNLRINVRYDKQYGTASMFVYRALLKYNKCPVIYYQTDYAAPFWFSGEAYGNMFSNLFSLDKLWSNRNLYVIAAGSDANAMYIDHLHHYTIDEVVKITYLPPDLHFMIELSDLGTKYEMPPTLSGIGFAAKERISGSRTNLINQYLTADTPFTLAGKWKDETVAKFKSLNPNFKFIGRLPNYGSVVDLYNKEGATLYLSSSEYHKANTVTSRLYDAIHAKAIPFINASDYPTFVKVFGEFPELCVTPSTLSAKIVEFQDIELREKVLKNLIYAYTSRHKHVRKLFHDKIEEILLNGRKDVPLDFDVIMDRVEREGMKKLRRNKPNTKEELEERVQSKLANRKADLDEHFKEPMKAKMQLGIFGEYPDRGTMSDVPPELLKSLLDFMTNKTIP